MTNPDRSAVASMPTMAAAPTMPDVRELVPHARAMVLLDRVLSADHDNLCAEVSIHAGSMLGSQQGVGAWVGIEYMAQAIAAHAGWRSRQLGAAARVGFLLGARKYQARVPYFVPGSVLRVHVHRVLQSENGLGAFDCRIDLVDAADAVTDALTTVPALATAMVTVFQPDNVNQFLEDGKAG